MPRRDRCRGVTIIEFAAATSIAAVLGGTILILMTGARDAYQTHTLLNQISGYLEVATAVLRRDIWGATSATETQPPGNGVCPNKWLELTNSSTSTTITYCLDNSDAANVKLQRRVNGGAAWNVAQFMVVGVNTDALPDSPRAGMVTINLQVKRTVNGRDHLRTISGVRYLKQTP